MCGFRFQLGTSFNTPDPAQTAASTSTINARAYPLWAAMGSREPGDGHTLVSVVGSPSPSATQVSGMALPCALADHTLAAATELTAMSMRIGFSFPAGA